MTSGLSAQLALDIINTYSVKTLKEKFNGFVYRGGYDGKSIVCWYPNDLIVPLEMSRDNGKSWISVKDYINGEDTSKYPKGSFQQLAKDIKTELEKSPDKKVTVQELKDKIEKSKIPRVEKAKMSRILNFLISFYNL